MTIAIDKLYMNKMPKSCKECPLTYRDTGDDAYFGANERRCVIDDSCIDGMTSERPYDCPLVEAIPKADYETRLTTDMATIKQLSNSVKVLRKANLQIEGAYDKLKSDYENRLKADMVAMLKEMSKTIEEEREDCEKLSNSYERFGIKAMAQRSQIVIQQKINALKEQTDGK
jgi:hypothetical protein